MRLLSCVPACLPACLSVKSFSRANLQVFDRLVSRLTCQPATIRSGRRVYPWTSRLVHDGLALQPVPGEAKGTHETGLGTTSCSWGVLRRTQGIIYRIGWRRVEGGGIYLERSCLRSPERFLASRSEQPVRMCTFAVLRISLCALEFAQTNKGDEASGEGEQRTSDELAVDKDGRDRSLPRLVSEVGLHPPKTGPRQCGLTFRTAPMQSRLCHARTHLPV